VLDEVVATLAKTDTIKKLAKGKAI
jgi:hypothetical protein